MSAWMIAALSMGFLGSFHCIGMCGPIALALPIGRVSAIRRVFGVLVYNSGRILTYATGGILFGFIGNTVAFAGYQQVLSVTIGILLLLSVLIPARVWQGQQFTSGIFSWTVKLKTTLGALFSKQSRSSLFLIGLLNGLLPCGLVYMGIAGAVATGDTWKGLFFMALFGAGTLPAMVFLPLIGGFITLPVRNAMRRAVPYVISLMACLLILRGLNLGIPYISPAFHQDKVSGCCQHARYSCKPPAYESHR